MAEYPEHDKLCAIKDQSQAIGAFIEWMGEHGYHICERTHAVSESANQVIEAPEPGTWQRKRLGDRFCDLLGALIDANTIYWPTTKRLPNALLAQYFDIDEDKLETEKRAMLDELRKGHTK